MADRQQRKRGHLASCNICKRTFKASENKVTCSKCKSDQHVSCAGLSRADVEKLKQRSKNILISFLCNSCADNDGGSKASGVESVNWVKMTSRMPPPTSALVGGLNQHGCIWVARARTPQGCIVPGKVIPSYHQACFVWDCDDNKQIENRKQYEILCEETDAYWQSMETDKDQIPPNAIQGGRCAVTQELFFIGRVQHGASVTCGKVCGNPPQCKVVFGGTEHPFDVFEILVLKPAPSAASSLTKGQVRVPTITKAITVGKATTVKASVGGETAPFNLTELSETHPERTALVAKMQSTIMNHVNTPAISKYNIIKVQRVWNEQVFNRFSTNLEFIKKKNGGDPNEKRLFHGSPRCAKIAEEGFDECHASTSGMFGAGIYFAEHSSKSNQYSFGLNAPCTVHNDKSCTICERQMLSCRVVLGAVHKLTTAHNSLAHAPAGYQSVMGVPGPNLRYPEYIVYRGEQAFPEHLITYTLVLE